MIPLKVFSHYSLLEAFAQPKDLVNKAFDLKLKALPLTDFHSISGCVEFLQEIKKKNEKSEHKVKPILGSTLRVFIPELGTSYITVYCQNKTGWHNLIKIIACSKLDKEHLVVSFKDLQNHKEGLIFLIGGLRSHFIYLVSNKDKLNNFIDLIKTLPNIFLIKENHGLDYEKLVNDIIDQVDLPKLQSNCVHYANVDDLLYQQILVCSKLKTTLANAKMGLFSDIYYSLFFSTSNNDLKDSYPECNNQILDLIEDFNIKCKPIIPNATIPKEFKDADDYLLHLCRQGWRSKDLNTKLKDNKDLEKVYIDRIKDELRIFKEAELSNYILIIWQLMQFCHKNKVHVGLRGSAVGCLVSYLIDISDVDPIIPDPTLSYHPDRCLLFERFFNSGRLNKGEISFEEFPYRDYDKCINK